MLFEVLLGAEVSECALLFLVPENLTPHKVSQD